MSLKPVVRVRQLGRMAFAEAYGIQTQTAEALRREILAKPAVLRRNTLLLVEHEPVFTIGIRSKGYTSEDESRLRKLGADFVKTNRGGLITFHGPGQLVAYPILYLGSFNEQKSMRWYVCQLEKTIVDTCAHFGLRADTTQETGVWIGDNKIAAIGNAPTHSGNRRSCRKWFYSQREQTMASSNGPASWEPRWLACGPCEGQKDALAISSCPMPPDNMIELLVPNSALITGSVSIFAKN